MSRLFSKYKPLSQTSPFQREETQRNADDGSVRDGDRPCGDRSSLANDGSADNSGDGVPPSSGETSGDGERSGKIAMPNDGDRISSGDSSSPPLGTSASGDMSTTNNNGPCPKDKKAKKKKTKDKKAKDKKTKKKKAKNKNTKNMKTTKKMTKNQKRKAMYKKAGKYRRIRNKETRTKSHEGAKDNAAPKKRKTRRGRRGGRRVKKILNEMCHVMFDWAAAILDKGEQAKRSLRLADDEGGTVQH